MNLVLFEGFFFLEGGLGGSVELESRGFVVRRESGFAFISRFIGCFIREERRFFFRRVFGILERLEMVVEGVEGLDGYFIGVEL